ncbi:MAG: hypothetical protein HFE28_00595 [Clostridia bacterium]|jgi:peptide/nickel transport system substrate-binding protein|nr:hypothetical protein [Clostridia bacterium]
MKKQFSAVAACILATACFATACGQGGGNAKRDNEKDPLRLSIQPVEGLFSPFFSTAATDSSVTGMTQISMLTTDPEGNLACGDEYPCVVKDYSVRMFDKSGALTEEGDNDGKTVYQFVIKNGIKFSDGTPLTIKDVLFNLYIYLDPVYTGSSTVYSTDIVGLKAYQSLGVITEDDSDDESPIISTARSRAQIRIANIGDYLTKTPETGSALTDDETKQAEKDAKTLAELFRQEVETDWNSAVESLENYTKEYVLTEEWEAYLLREGVTKIKTNAQGKPVKEGSRYVIDYASIEQADIADHSRETMVDFVYEYYQANRLVRGGCKKFAEVLGGWASGGTLSTQIVAEEQSLVIEEFKKQGNYPRTVSGITVVDGADFVKSQESRAASYSESDSVLQIVINGVDPKAVWNFGFNVAPMHYYSDASVSAKYDAQSDYHAFNAPGTDGYDAGKETNFGFPMGDYTYFTDVIQARNKVPMGAGIYKATDVNNSLAFSDLKTGFYNAGNIYYVRNDYFYTTMKGGSDPTLNAKIKYVRYKELDSRNVLNAITTAAIDYTDISATNDNIAGINAKSFLGSARTKTNGYGYIGINAGKIPDINLRRAIMSVLDASLVKSYYPGDLSEEINRPLSTCSWVYNYGETENTKWQPTAKYRFDSKNPDLSDYEEYMALAASSCSAEKGTDGLWYYRGADGMGERKPLKFTFTIAGGSDDHPAYLTLSEAAKVLNDQGWQININPDSRALTLLASGSLTVWCAAWSATIDPDMYQVYHMESKASSVKAWGYDEILKRVGSEDYTILETLSQLIDDGRKTIDQAARANIYQEALGLVMDLAIEYPLYQRNDLFAYNKNVIDENTLNLPASTYSSPIDKLWEVSYKNQ